MDASLAGEKLPRTARKSSFRVPHLEISAVWIRFLLAIVGLLLAFGAALFSTVSREAGNLPATLIFASIALVLAVVIGLTTVPYLAKRVAATRIRNAVDYKVTRLGVIYVTVVLLIGIAALNTGNNLLYIVVAAMLAAILVSGLVSAIVLRDLELDIRIPQHVFAGEPVRARLGLRNPRMWLPCFSVSVVPSKRSKETQRWRWEVTTFAFPPSRPQDKQWLKLPDRKLQRVPRAAKGNCILTGTTYFPYIPSRESVKAELDLIFTRRGRYREESFGLASGFPFAFLIKTRHLPFVREILAYPSVRSSQDHMELLSAIQGEIESSLRGEGNDLHRLREYVPNDSARRVDWKATAKTGALKVREFSRPQNRKIRIVFDNPAPGCLSQKKYEEAVATVSSLAWHLTAKNTEVSYITQKYIGGTGVHSFLSFLATVEPTSSPCLLNELDVSGDFNIIVTARGRDETPSHLGQCSYFVFVGPSR